MRLNRPFHNVYHSLENPFWQKSLKPNSLHEQWVSPHVENSHHYSVKPKLTQLSCFESPTVQKYPDVLFTVKENVGNREIKLNNKAKSKWPVWLQGNMVMQWLTLLPHSKKVLGWPCEPNGALVLLGANYSLSLINFMFNHKYTWHQNSWGRTSSHAEEVLLFLVCLGTPEAADRHQQAKQNVAPAIAEDGCERSLVSKKTFGHPQRNSDQPSRESGALLTMCTVRVGCYWLQRRIYLGRKENLGTRGLNHPSLGVKSLRQYKKLLGGSGPGVDDIHPQFLKAAPWPVLVGMPLHCSEVSLDWQTWVVVPILKKGNWSISSSYKDITPV